MQNSAARAREGRKGRTIEKKAEIERERERRGESGEDRKPRSEIECERYLLKLRLQLDPNLTRI